MAYFDPDMQTPVITMAVFDTIGTAEEYCILYGICPAGWEHALQHLQVSLRYAIDAQLF